MKFIRQKIFGVYLIKPEPHEDKRGMLRRHFCKKELKQKQINFDIKQINVSENLKEYTLRGFHYQKKPHGEDKIISCIQGSIYDIVVDLREESKTYKKWQSYKLTQENRMSLFVPKGCANAYLTLENKTWILYYHSEFYKKISEKRIRYNDPSFNFVWPKQPKVISKEDLNANNFNNKK